MPPSTARAGHQGPGGLHRSRPTTTPPSTAASRWWLQGLSFFPSGLRKRYGHRPPAPAARRASSGHQLLALLDPAPAGPPRRLARAATPVQRQRHRRLPPGQGLLRAARLTDRRALPRADPRRHPPRPRSHHRGPRHGRRRRDRRLRRPAPRGHPPRLDPRRAGRNPPRLLGDESKAIGAFRKAYRGAQGDEARLAVVRRFLQLTPHDSLLRRRPLRPPRDPRPQRAAHRRDRPRPSRPLRRRLPAGRRGLALRRVGRGGAEARRCLRAS